MATGDQRLAWVLADLLLFQAPRFDLRFQVRDAWRELTGVDPATPWWKSMVDHLIAEDVPPPRDFVEIKRRIYLDQDERWAPFFEDEDADVDWRWVAWGGVAPDAREVGDGSPCLRRCIPALDDPIVTPASEGDWYPDDRIVFGVDLNGEARAYPKHFMEVHEMVNDELGGRRIGLPYCSLCGSAQAFLTDNVLEDESLILRTSGLLSRSNKIMYDLRTQSMFDTFVGKATSGPLQDEGVVLDTVPLLVTTWGDWKANHPDTTILRNDAGGIGELYPLDPLGSRDDNGPIFAVGDVDPRFDAHEQVLGVETADGTPVAFPLTSAMAALADGIDVAAGGVRLVPQDGSARAETFDGEPLDAHQSFWFAWSQFNPTTLVWEP